MILLRPFVSALFSRHFVSVEFHVSLNYDCLKNKKEEELNPTTFCFCLFACLFFPHRASFFSFFLFLFSSLSFVSFLNRLGVQVFIYLIGDVCTYMYNVCLLLFACVERLKKNGIFVLFVKKEHSHREANVNL